MGRRTILHIIESFGAGSANAMRTFAQSTPEHRHVLLRAVRPGEYRDGAELPEFESVHELPSGVAARVLAIRGLVRSVRPDVVHAHSTIAGALARVALVNRVHRKVLYSPHCFAFERKDLAAPVRAVIVALELVLAVNTHQILACSHREARLGARLPVRAAPLLVPNIPRSSPGSTPRPSAAASSDVPTVVALGRIGAQKNPTMFAALVVSLRRRVPNIRAVWIGGGDGCGTEALENAGVEVTGWLPADGVMSRLAASTLYVHTAAWEGFPLAILEAVQAGLPLIAHRIGALEGMPTRWQFDSSADGARLAAAILRGDVSENRAEWTHALAGNTRSLQRAALERAYR